ncbi:hypothetical protein OVA24_08720 [Luteolibacter sp. SL250]|uniref:hypothetical protein n=1 Tax=Luteolibacter sp. SL250 TaxID=2995170 RepID=UPI002271C426|nr:hypothetical protein [Luteolibacter sp. SL250]WAC21468.1 hypothetical protein OVA24_08720 [Luteolibacter sp. SL250]
MNRIIPFLCISLLAGCSRGGWSFTPPAQTENLATGMKGNATFSNRSPYMAVVDIGGDRRSVGSGRSASYDGLAGLVPLEITLMVSGSGMKWKEMHFDADSGYSLEFR